MSNENKELRTARNDRRPLTRYLFAVGLSILLVGIYLLTQGFFSQEGLAKFAVDSGLVIGTSGDLLMPEEAAYAVIEGVADAESVLKSPDLPWILHVSRLRMLTDAFFTAGVLVFGIGSLIFASQEGVFDGLTYSMKQLWWIFQFRNRGDKHENFREYKKRLSEKPKARFAHMMICGAVLLVIAGIFTLIFNKL